MHSQERAITPGVIVRMLFFVVLLPFLPLLISGRWDWLEAWVYALTSILASVISRVLALRRHPDLAVERARFTGHENAKPWDRRLTLLLGVGGILVLVVAGLDERFGWPPQSSAPVKIVSLAAIWAGFALSSYALIENRFFSATVRIQTDRGHQVVSSGPYRWIRHPGYAGGLLAYAAAPFLLDSLWALLPTLFTIVVTVIRTSLEDRTLQEELIGYCDYVGQVRNRLVPGVW
jgi:protein-S-isoprenylcysteine O-methyltransferase Ste14